MTIGHAKCGRDATWPPFCTAIIFRVNCGPIGLRGVVSQTDALPKETIEPAAPTGPSPSLQAAPQAVKRSMPAALAVLLGLLGTIFLIWFLTKLVWLILLLYLSFLLATVLDAPVSWLRAKGIPRGLSATFLMLLIGAAIITAVALASNAAYAQFQEVSVSLQKMPERLNTWVQQFRQGHPAFRDVLQDFDAQKTMGEVAATQHVASAARGLLAGASTGLEFLASAIVLFFVTLYMTIDGEDYLKAGRRLLPQSARWEATRVMRAMAKAHRGWLFATLANVCSASILSSLGLWLVGVPAAPVLGVIAGCGELVPNIGPGLAALPAVLVTLMVAPEKFLLVVLMFAIVQTVQGYGISPHVMRHGVALPPLVTIVAVLVMGTLFGALGVLVAIPLTADLVVVWNYANTLLEKDTTDYDTANHGPVARHQTLPIGEAGGVGAAPIATGLPAEVRNPRDQPRAQGEMGAAPEAVRGGR